MSITVDLPDSLLRRLEAQARRLGREPDVLLAEYLEQGLERSEPAPEPAPAAGPRHRSDPPVVRRAAATGKVTPALSNAEIAAILDEEDGRRAV